VVISKKLPSQFEEDEEGEKGWAEEEK